MSADLTFLRQREVYLCFAKANLQSCAEGLAEFWQVGSWPRGKASELIGMIKADGAQNAEALAIHFIVKASVEMASKSAALVAQPIDGAPKDGGRVLVNDTSQDGEWVFARYLHSDLFSGWVYDNEISNELSPDGPGPTVYLRLPDSHPSAPTGSDTKDLR